ncbi:MAG: hypothetical protein ACYTFY_17115 [Planctomycetota bacterium]
MSASEINGSTPQPVQPTPQQNVEAVETRIVRAEEVQRELEANSPKTTPPEPAGPSEPYKGDSIDTYA